MTWKNDCYKPKENEKGLQRTHHRKPSFLHAFCFNFAKYSANAFYHVVFRLMQTRLAAPSRSLYNVYLLPLQPSCDNFVFLYILPMYRLSVVSPQLIVG